MGDLLTAYLMKITINNKKLKKFGFKDLCIWHI